MDRMRRLGELLVDEDIGTPEVCLRDDDDEQYGDPVPLADAIALARSRGLHLIPTLPFEVEDDPAPFCEIVPLLLPPEWESDPEAGQPPDFDEELWFESTCGRRDLLAGRSCHTYPGRMSAWCPHDDVYYCVSLDEMGEMSEATRYFVTGFLAGAAPDIPIDADGETSDADLAAWDAATRSFRREGFWSGYWNTCEECGRVLYPSNRSGRCRTHQR
jgi:hypothetical protein